MERPCSGQAECILWGKAQCVWLGAHYHTPRALKWHPPEVASHDYDDDEKKVKELSFSWGPHAFLPHMSGLRGCGCNSPPSARAHSSSASWVSPLVLDYPVQGFRPHVWTCSGVCGVDRTPDGHWEWSWTVLHSTLKMANGNPVTAL